MVLSKEPKPFLPVRLKFQASDALNESLLAFTRPETREALLDKAKVEGKRFTLFSEQVALLGLDRSARSDKEMVSLSRYEKAVGSVRRTNINLQPGAEVDKTDERFIKIRLALFLQADKALHVLMRPPLFPDPQDDIVIYTRIPRKYVASDIEVQLAERNLRISMGESMTAAEMAPWAMNVTGATVVKEPTAIQGSVQR
jgi:hypothetical protein